MYKLMVIASLCMLALLTGNSTTAYAASCPAQSELGMISGTVSVPTAGEYVVWLRVQPATSSGDIANVELGNNTCFTVSAQGMSTSELNWVQHSGTDQANQMKYTFSAAGSYPVKVIGLQEGVRIERVLLLGTNELCSSNGSNPSGDGTNCSTGLSVGGGSTGQSTTPATLTPSIVSALPPEQVEKVEYYVNGSLVQTNTGAEGLDSVLLDNGQYELVTKVTLKDGSVVEQKDTITIAHDSGVVSVANRFFHRNKVASIIGISVVGLGSVAGVLLFGLRLRHHRKMFMLHHGIAT